MKNKTIFLKKQFYKNSFGKNRFLKSDFYFSKQFSKTVSEIRFFFFFLIYKPVYVSLKRKTVLWKTILVNRFQKTDFYFEKRQFWKRFYISENSRIKQIFFLKKNKKQKKKVFPENGFLFLFLENSFLLLLLLLIWKQFWRTVL